MIKVIIILIISFFSMPVIAESIANHKKLEECLSEFYQGRPRDYPSESEKKEILVFKTEDGREYYHSKELRGMETICYKLFSFEN